MTPKDDVCVEATRVTKHVAITNQLDGLDVAIGKLELLVVRVKDHPTKAESDCVKKQIQPGLAEFLTSAPDAIQKLAARVDAATIELGSLLF